MWTVEPGNHVQALVFTHNLLKLDEWQRKHDLLPSQLPSKSGQKLVQRNVETDVLEHRSIELPLQLVSKLVAIEGVVGITQDRGSPSPFTQLEEVTAADAEPTTVKSSQIHNAVDAWSQNVTGTGVRVAVVDSGIDFAHPDLNGTQARVNDSSSPWDGWPIMFDERSMRIWLRDGDAYPASGASWFADTTTTDNDSDNDSKLDSSNLSIVGIPASVSGVYHIGEHPDSKLVNRAGGDVPILVVDDLVSGEYTTVYVDTNRDGNFSDEQPMRRGSETAGRDTDGDGLWDRSAGLIYWIADGNNSLPYAPTFSARAGYADRIPTSGSVVLFMLNDANEGGGNHGTLCASAVGAQAVANNGRVQGMAPDVGLIAVANYYSSGTSVDSWRFVAEGYDGLSNSGDEAHIGSFSFGYSQVHNDGADYFSMYLDWLTRSHAPQTTYFVAVGNGGHGYGTTASPGGAQGIISVGAFSSLSGQGTWGDSASWSNRGPNGVARLDPDIVTVGWSATGDRTLNEVTNANSATTTWSGTSLATPVAAGLGALVFQAWYEEYGSWPDSQQVRDIIMSTADDKGYDPLVQGAGWFNASAAVDSIRGANGSFSVRPAAWMAGRNNGWHRDANLNVLFPGDNDSTALTVSNRGATTLNVTVEPVRHVPLWHREESWNSSSALGWDGHQGSIPDLVYPIHIKADANLSLPNGTVLVRARAAMHGLGFDGNQNYQSENRVMLAFERWTDDGDGVWWNDSNGDGQVNSSDEWDSGDTFRTITSHTYPTPESEVRVGLPLEESGDGILLFVWRQNIRTSLIDPLPISIDITAFGRATDSWLTAPANISIAPNSTAQIPVRVDIPVDARPGLQQHGVRISSQAGRSWILPVITNVGVRGPFSSSALPLDGNMSNQTLYDAHWLQGAQRWGWRSESGDWKSITVDWPSNLSANGSIVIDVDWPDNNLTDVDVHWLNEVSHPFQSSAPAAYGPYTFDFEVSSYDTDRGGGVYGYQTSTGSSHEMLLADSTPGLKQMLLHSAMHGVNTIENPLNISVGYVTTIGSSTSYKVRDWARSSLNESVTIGATLPLDVSSAIAHGWTQPRLLPQEVALQDSAGTISSSSYIRPITLSQVTQFKVEIDSNSPGVDLDLYLFRDVNSDTSIGWSTEQMGVSGSWNSKEEIIIDAPADGQWWIVVHGFEVPNGNTTFWLRQTEVRGSEFIAGNVSNLNASQISALWPNGTSELAGAVPDSAFEIDLTLLAPPAVGIWQGWLELELIGSGSFSLPFEYELVEEAPRLRFTTPTDGTYTNQTIPVSLHAEDIGAGFNLSELQLTFSNATPMPQGITVEVQNIDGANAILTQPWMVINGLAMGNVSENRSALESSDWRSVWVNFSIAPFDGWQGFHAELYDSSGRWNSTSLSVTYDSLDPQILSWEGMPWNNLTNQTTLSLVGHIETGATIWIDGALLVNRSNGSFPLQLNLTQEGTNRFDLLFLDPAGNWGEHVLHIERDTTPPSMKFVNLPEQAVNTTNFNLTGWVEWDAYACFDIWVEQLNGSSETQNLDGSPVEPVCSVRPDPIRLANAGGYYFWRWFELQDLPEGRIDLHLVGRDFAGNWADLETYFIIDRTAPEISWEQPDSLNLTHHQQRLKWSVSEQATMLLRIDTTQVWNGMGNGSFAWSIELERAGDHEFCVTAFDVAGNIREDCMQLILPTEIYSPAVDAAWNGSRINSKIVNATLYLGPDQFWQLSRIDIISGNSTSIGFDQAESSEVVLTFELEEGLNKFLLQVSALDRVFIFELEVELDTVFPILTIDSPLPASHHNGFVVPVRGDCESGQEVGAELSGQAILVECESNDRYNLLIELPATDGNYSLRLQSDDGAGNFVNLTRELTVDRQAPRAILAWSQEKCGPRPTTTLFGLDKSPECTISAEATFLDDDVTGWSLTLQRWGRDVSHTSGVGNPPGDVVSVFDAEEGAPGRWSAQLYVRDAAGNEKRIELETDLSAGKASAFQNLITVGSVWNIVGILLCCSILFAMLRYRSTRRKELAAAVEVHLQEMEQLFAEEEDEMRQELEIETDLPELAMPSTHGPIGPPPDESRIADANEPQELSSGLPEVIDAD
uniref:Pyrolisin-like serine protease n=1 Tax=uncultured marine group II/III euryarchaeote KM3_80_G12 TaxID=1456515 RepID=A0A075HUF7_9EURY|nr:pyrolisin-like serine protease [uncultured marine group II/III euryarchaeote KM3_80_G12]